MRRKIAVLFTFSVLPSLPYARRKHGGKEYRGVRGIDGGYRMESKGLNSKLFVPHMWTGSYESLESHYEAVRLYYGEKYVTPLNLVNGVQQ